MGHSAAAASHGQPIRYSQAAQSSKGPYIHSPAGISTTATRMSGTKMKLMSGMAATFTTSPANERLSNHARVTDASVSDTAACTVHASRKALWRIQRPFVTRIIAPIATKESQNPEASGANGSSHSTDA